MSTYNMSINISYHVIEYIKTIILAISTVVNL